VFLLGSPEQVAADRARLAAGAAAAGRPLPAVTANAMLTLAGDDTLPAPAEIARRLADPDGMFGFPSEAAADAARISGIDTTGSYLARLERAGAERAVVTLPAGDWYRQAGLLAEAAGTAIACTASWQPIRRQRSYPGRMHRRAHTSNRRGPGTGKIN
jgi:hypothetical protein